MGDLYVAVENYDIFSLEALADNGIYPGQEEANLAAKIGATDILEWMKKRGLPQPDQ